METMKDLVNRLYEMHGLKSEAELARLLGISPQAMNEYNSGRSKYFSDQVAYRIAKLLKEDPAYVFLIREHQRARDTKIKAVWKEVIEKVGKHAAALLLAVFLLFSNSPAKASFYITHFPGPFIHYTKRLWRRLLRRILLNLLLINAVQPLHA